MVTGLNIFRDYFADDTDKYVLIGGVSYNKLWKMLIDKNMKKMDLLEAIEMSPNTLAKLGRNEDVSMDVLKRICAYLQCDIGDIMEMIPEDENGH